MLETLLGSRLRAKALVCLFTHADERYYVRQLTALIGEDSTNVSRELARLEKTGILLSTIEGKQKYYQANRGSPAFNPIEGLVKRIPIMVPPLSGDRLSQRLRVNKSQLAEFCRLNHIRRLALFGSVLRDDFKPESDVDVLVEFQPGKAPGFLKLGGLEEELSIIIGGRKVDLRTAQDLSKHFRSRVLKEAIAICP